MKLIDERLSDLRIAAIKMTRQTEEEVDKTKIKASKACNSKEMKEIMKDEARKDRHIGLDAGSTNFIKRIIEKQEQFNNRL